MQPDRDITALLPRLLADIKRAGDFYGTGEVPLPVVRLAVDGVGILGLPLAPMQVEALARVATPAPYGRGGDTLVDPEVRRCGQIGASAVDARDGRWQALLDTVVARAAAALGVEGGATASLYKHLRARSALPLAPPADAARSRDRLPARAGLNAWSERRPEPAEAREHLTAAATMFGEMAAATLPMNGLTVRLALAWLALRPFLV